MQIDRTQTGDGCWKYECWDYYGCSIVGSAIVKRVSDHVYLQDINIASAYRGQGIGTELLQRIVNDFELPVVADVFKDRVRWYERNGFQLGDNSQHLVRMVRPATKL